MTGVTSTCEDSDLERYLARVEELDSRRNYNKTKPSRPTVKPKPPRLSEKYAYDDLEKAHLILEGHYASSRYEDLSPTRVSKMAYKSAYNYDKTFSPKKPKSALLSPISTKTPSKSMPDEPGVLKFDDIYSSSPTKYVVSKEEYELLQRLKRGLSTETVEEMKIPRRGKPREKLPIERVRISYSLGKATEVTNVSSDEDENPPPLPSRRITDSISTATSQNKQDLTNPLPKLGSSTRKLEKTPPQLPPKRSNLDRIPAFEKEPPSLSHASYPSSTHKNKNHMPKDSVPFEKETPESSHVSYLESLENNKITTSTHAVSKSPSPVRKAPSDPKSFVDSALKAAGSPKNKLAPSVLPRIPAKPASLRKSVEQNTSADIDDTLTEKLKNMKLNPVKQKPQVPPKKCELVIPKLRNVDRAPTRKKDTEDEIDGFPALKPAPNSPQRSPSIPEAIKKKMKLSKAPPVPQRKISIPEALKRAEVMKANRTRFSDSEKKDTNNKEAMEVEALKIARSLKHTTPTPRIQEDEVEALTMGKRIFDSSPAKNKTLNKSKTFDSSQIPVAIPFMAHAHEEGLKKLFHSKTDSEIIDNKTASEPTGKLTHVTKNRARGPRRKLPSNVSSNKV